MKFLKNRKKRNRLVRAAIQLIFFIIAPGLFSAAFSGVRYLITQIHDMELIEVTPFVSILLILLAYTVLAGRFFCGYACAFGTLGDTVYGISSFLQKKIRGKILRVPDGVLHKLQYVKYAVLAAILVLCFFGWYAKVSMADPWELFASFTSGSFSLSGHAAAACVLGAIIIGMCIVPRFFCQFLCPMGAVFAMMPVIPVSIVNKDSENCIKGCSACRRSCPASLDIDGFSGDCFQCGACADTCPKGNIGLGEKRRFKGSEIILTIIKAGVLFAICYPWM